jgi:hypothetical protein
MPRSWRRPSRRGWPSLGRMAKPPRLRKPARVVRKRPSCPAVLSSWPLCAPVRSSALPRRRPLLSLRTGAGPGASGGPAGRRRPPRHSFPARLDPSRCTMPFSGMSTRAPFPWANRVATVIAPIWGSWRRNRAFAADGSPRTPTTCGSCSCEPSGVGSAMNSPFRSAGPTIGPFIGMATRSIGGGPPASTRWRLPKLCGSTPGSTGHPYSSTSETRWGSPPVFRNLRH